MAITRPVSAVRSYSTTSASDLKTSNNFSGFWRRASWITGARPYPDVPHLLGHPLTGRLPDLQNRGPLNTMMEAAQLAGAKGMCSFWVENRLMLLLFSPHLIHSYKTKYQVKHMQPQMDFWDTMVGCSAASQDRKSLRKIYIEAFSSRSFISIQNIIAHLCSQKMRELATTGEIQDVDSYFRLFTTELAMSAFMGVEAFKIQSSAEILDLLNSLFRTTDPDFGLMTLNLKNGPEKRYFGQQEVEQYRQHAEKTGQVLFNLLIQPYMKQILNNKNHVFYKIWELSKTVRREQKFTIENLFSDAFFFLVGGPVLSISDSFPLIIKAICEHPDVHNKLDELFTNDKKAGYEYLEQIIKETFRIQPPISIIPARTIETPFDFHGTTINSGDSIIISPYVTHHLDSVWSEPNKFDPDRFSKQAIHRMQPGAYLPFGLGGTSCPGRLYGITVLQAYLSHLFEHYKITSIHNRAEVRQQADFLSRVDGKLQLTLEPRDQNTLQMRMGRS